MRLLVTRPQPDAGDLAAQLETRGHEAVIEPLLVIRFDTESALTLDGVQGLIATSRNGLRALAARSLVDQARKLPLFAVGPGTAAMARSLGFATVAAGPADGCGLAGLVTARASPEAGPLLHLAGDKLAWDLAGALERQGFRILQPIVYTSQEAAALSARVRSRLRERSLDGVLLFSPRTAATYARLVRHHGLVEFNRTVAHYCLSRAVAGPLEAIAPQRTLVASRPNLQVMLDLIG